MGPLSRFLRTLAAPAAARPVPFVALFRRLDVPAHRRFAGLWLVSCLVIVPSGMLTRIFEWTGLPLTVGGVETHITIYLPLVLCLPYVLWFGYLWGAIPAYLSTFCVALLGGMPVAFALLFSLANPIGLAVLYLGYRAIPVRADLRSIPSLLFYVQALFVASLAGSAGSFLWAQANHVGIHRFYPVWQGWWLGGVLQGLLVSGPLLLLFGPAIERWKQRRGFPTVGADAWRRGPLLVGALAVIGVVAGFVLVVQRFSRAALAELVASDAPAGELADELGNVLAGVALPHWVLLAFVAVTLFLGYRIGVLVSTSYRDMARALEDANRELEAKNERLHRESITDFLTGAYNRAYFLDSLEREISLARRRGRPVSVLLVDLDRFKSVNDDYGHLAGDEVLRSVAKLLARVVRREDVLARFGGEEFVVLLPRTDLAQALVVAEKIRAAVEAARFELESGESLSVTTSLGVAELEGERGGTEAPRELLARADAALYAAKDRGRNRTVTADELDDAALSA